MHGLNGALRSRNAWIFGFSIATWAAVGCSSDGDQSNPAQGASGGSVATSGSSGAAVAGSGGNRVAGASGGPMPGMSALTAGRAGGATAGSAAQPSAAGAAAGSGGAAGVGGAPSPIVGGSGGQGGATAMGTSGAGGMMAPTDPSLPAGATNFVSVCAGGKVGMGSDAAGMLRGLDVGREYAGVKYLAKTPNQIVSFKTTLVVPKAPTTRSTLFIWPGLQSRDGAADPARIGNGVLQPVLTWGGSCAPKRPSDVYAGWWIAGMYVTLSSNVVGPGGCGGGDYVSASVGDWLEIDMFLKDEKWVQTIKDVQMNKLVDYTVDLKGQVQNAAMWLIEQPDGTSIKPVEDTIWLQNVLTFSMPVTSCQPNQKGSVDSFSAPTLSTDGLHCCWDKIVLKADRGGMR